MDDSEVRTAFDHYDTDSNGQIDMKEFTELIRSLDEDMDDAQRLRAFQIIDLDEDGRIDFTEFHEWWTS